VLQGVGHVEGWGWRYQMRGQEEHSEGRTQEVAADQIKIKRLTTKRTLVVGHRAEQLQMLYWREALRRAELTPTDPAKPACGMRFIVAIK
jgi:hypothetical protein